jgi:acyl-coenzyme A synthetase/AMP-(fatty) acid ligase
MTAWNEAPLDRLCVESLGRDPELQAIEFAGEWVRWGQMRHVAERVNALLQASGLHVDAPVVFVPRNRPSAAAAFLGMLAKGRTVRMVYAFQSPAAMAREILRLAPAAVVADAADFSPEVRDALRERGAAAIALTEMDAAAVLGLEQAREPGLEADQEPPQVQILTSGTTGPPKRFGLAYDMIARHIVGANKNYQAATDFSKTTPAFLYYPLGNISGISSVLPALLRGHRLVLTERFSVELWREYIRRHRPERASLPPAGFQMVLDANVPPEELAGVRSIATGAAPLHISIQHAFRARYNIPILFSYGATELGGPVTSMTPELHDQWGDSKAGSVGRPIAGAQLRVVDPENGAELPPNQEGILEVVAPRIGPDWIRTSDLAVIDVDGFLFHRGRADGAIMRGGFKLLPETIERALLLHSAVSTAAIVGLDDARLGQVPVAAVQLKPGANKPQESELEQHLRDHLHATHIPVAWRFVDALPRTESFKVDGAAVRALFARNAQ